MRRLILLLCCFCLWGCGFRPLYMTENNIHVMQQAEQIKINPIANFGGYQMGLILQQKLNPKQINPSKKWELRVQLADPVFYDQSIQGDNFASLEKITVSADYQLIDIKTNKQLISSRVSANGSYNIVNEPYATTMAKEKMYQNLIQILSEDIVLHIFSYLRSIISES